VSVLSGDTKPSSSAVTVVADPKRVQKEVSFQVLVGAATNSSRHCRREP